MTVLVAIPYRGVPAELLDTAVRCALAQTFADTVVLVAGDGEKPPIAFTHSRLVVGTFPNHRGAPFTQQAMILGSPFSHYAPHGADDWTERDHVASLMALRRPAAGSSTIWYHQDGRAPVRMTHRKTYIEFGVFDTLLLRRIGGYNAAEPCGQDSILIEVLVATAGVGLTRRPTYHKVHRADSLTHHPETGMGSPVRQAVRARNHIALAEMRRIGFRNLPAIRAYRDSLVPPSLRVELEDRAADVARWLA